MADKRRRREHRRAAAETAVEAFRRRPTQLRVRRRPAENAWELVHPHCALERAEDLEEVRKMIEAGETDVAVDELRWLLNGCSDCVLAHQMLGEVAAADGDLRLARGHFGYAYEIGLSALPPQGLPGPLPYRLPANQAFHKSAKGLARCLRELDKARLALEVVREMLKLDPSDPLQVGAWLAEWER